MSAQPEKTFLARLNGCIFVLDDEGVSGPYATILDYWMDAGMPADASAIYQALS